MSVAEAAWIGRLERELGAEAIATWREHPGAPDVPCVAPEGPEGFSAALRIAREARLAVVPTGFGSKRGWCRPAERVDLALSTRRYAGVSCYEPGDGTVTARAGTPMSALAAAVRAGGHQLSPDVPRPERATLGGVIAAAQSGFDRLRLGPVRGNVLGTRAMLADGRSTKSGGQLVKNVTGYDLHRLYCGSHGTLCVLLEVSLRLFPLPEGTAVLERACADRAEALAAARALLALPVRPLAAVAHDVEGGWKVALALAGRREVLRHEVALAHASDPALAVRDGDAGEARSRALRDLAPSGPALELLARPSALERALARVGEAAAAAGLRARTLAHPGVAQAWIALAPADGAPLDAARADALYRALAALGTLEHARFTWRGAPPELAADRFGEPSPGLPLMRRLKDALDPEGVFARGRFHGGL